MPACVCALLASGALPAADAESVDGPAMLDEVVVTARRREENLQTTPISVSAFTAADLERNLAGNLMDVAGLAPNLRRSAGPSGGSSGQYYIRGVGQLDFIASTDPGVGTYIDGVYLGRTIGAALDLLDVQRVEVLRGPQGTLFGRNAIGGAVNVVSTTPPAKFEQRYSLTGGERHLLEARASIGGSVREGLSMSAALLARDRDGWQRRLLDGDRQGDERTWAGRVVAQWQFDESTSFLATIDGTRSRGTGDPHYLAAANAARGGHPDYVLSDPDVTWAGQRSRDDLDVWGASLTASWQAGGVNFKSITGYRSLDSVTGVDFDGSPFDDLDQQVLTQQTQLSQELQISGLAVADKLHWLVGAYYFDERLTQGVPVVLYGTPLSQNNDLTNRSTALFSHLIYQLTPRISVSGGARFTHESKRHTFDHYFVLPTGPSPLFPTTTLRDSWNALTPKLGVEFRLTDDVMLYTSLSQGFRSGGFNGRPVGSDEFLAYDPEKLTTLEQGIKSEWLGHRLRLNGALFYSRYRDIQLTRAAIAASGAPIVVTGNAGKARITGAELELSFVPHEHWRFDASIGQLDTRYTELEPGAAVGPDNVLPVAPRWTLSASVDYARPLSDSLEWRVHVDRAYTARFNYFFDNPALGWEPAVGLWNLRTAIGARDGRWELAGYVTNLSNRRYALFREDVLSSYGFALVWPARPREWGLTLKYRFDVHRT